MNIRKTVEYLSKECQLKYFIYNEKSDYLLPFSVMIQITLDDQKYVSWGVGRDEDTAFYKAMMEIIERVSISRVCQLNFRKNILHPGCCLKEIESNYSIPIPLFHPSNSNGCGIGRNRRFAKKSAKYELIERHIILTALIKNIPPEEIDFFPANYRLPKNYKTRSFFWKCRDVYTSVIAMIHPAGGMYFGLASRDNLRECLTKAFEELTPNVIYSLTEKTPEDIQITKDELTSFSRYWRFSNDDRLMSFFTQKNKTHNLTLELPRDYFYTEYTIPDFAKSLDLTCVRVISPQAQQLFFDNWDYKYINPLASSYGISLPEFPHFIS